MHASPFETLLRSLSLAPSRRTLSRALLGLAFGSAVPVAQRAAAKKKKPCPPCKKRKQGKCKANLPNETPCSGGKCQNGSCVPTVPPPPLGPGFCGYDGTSPGLQASQRWALTFLAPGATITAAKIGLRINPANFSLTFEIRPVDGAGLPTSAMLG